MKKLFFFAIGTFIISSAFLTNNAQAAVGKNTCIIASCHASDKPACARETKLRNLVCSTKYQAADFCVSLIKCGANKKGQCMVTNDAPFQKCKSCVSECMGDAVGVSMDTRIACQRQCVAIATAPPRKAIPVAKTPIKKVVVKK